MVTSARHATMTHNICQKTFADPLRHTCLLSWLFVALTCQIAHGQSKPAEQPSISRAFSIRGRVVDASTHGVEGARAWFVVGWQPGDLKPPASATTDRQGNF